MDKIVKQKLNEKGHSNPESASIELESEVVEMGLIDNQVRQVDTMIKEISRLDDMIEKAYDKLSSFVNYSIKDADLDPNNPKHAVILKWRDEYMGNTEEVRWDWNDA